MCVGRTLKVTVNFNHNVIQLIKLVCGTQTTTDDGLPSVILSTLYTDLGYAL